MRSSLLGHAAALALALPAIVRAQMGSPDVLGAPHELCVDLGPVVSTGHVRGNVDELVSVAGSSLDFYDILGSPSAPSIPLDPTTLCLGGDQRAAEGGIVMDAEFSDSVGGGLALGFVELDGRVRPCSEVLRRDPAPSDLAWAVQGSLAGVAWSEPGAAGWDVYFSPVDLLTLSLERPPAASRIASSAPGPGVRLATTGDAFAVGWQDERPGGEPTWLVGIFEPDATPRGAPVDALADLRWSGAPLDVDTVEAFGLWASSEAFAAGSEGTFWPGPTEPWDWADYSAIDEAGLGPLVAGDYDWLDNMAITPRAAPEALFAVGHADAGSFPFQELVTTDGFRWSQVWYGAGPPASSGVEELYWSTVYSVPYTPPPWELHAYDCLDVLGGPMRFTKDRATGEAVLRCPNHADVPFRVGVGERRDLGDQALGPYTRSCGALPDTGGSLSVYTVRAR